MTADAARSNRWPRSADHAAAPASWPDQAGLASVTALSLVVVPAGPGEAAVHAPAVGHLARPPAAGRASVPASPGHPPQVRARLAVAGRLRHVLFASSCHSHLKLLTYRLRPGISGARPYASAVPCLYGSNIGHTSAILPCTGTDKAPARLSRGSAWQRAPRPALADSANGVDQARDLANQPGENPQRLKHASQPGRRQRPAIARPFCL